VDERRARSDAPYPQQLAASFDIILIPQVA